MSRFHIHHGDCIEAMGMMEPNSVDSIVTDPPYHLSTVKRFGKEGAAPAKHGTDGLYARASRGFMGQAWDGGDIAFRKEMWEAALRVLKPGGHLIAFSGSRTYHRMACAIEDAGFEIRDQIMWLYGTGFPKSHDAGNGWGTALKPAHEPILLARKPLVGTVAKTAQQFGTGAINIEASRIKGEGGRARINESSQNRRYADRGATNFAATPGPRGGDPEGRWPANVIHDGSDEVVEAFAQYGSRGASAPVKGTEPSAASVGRVTGVRERVPGAFHGDTGSAARFFYCAKASRSDRNAGLEGFEERPHHWSSGDKNPGSFQSKGTKKAAQNPHPTVKPTDLMRYLCTLVTPAGGLVLDPFMGSGSTGRGAMLGGFTFIGIEQDETYCGIAHERIRNAIVEKWEKGSTAPVQATAAGCEPVA